MLQECTESAECKIELRDACYPERTAKARVPRIDYTATSAGPGKPLRADVGVCWRQGYLSPEIRNRLGIPSVNTAALENH